MGTTGYPIFGVPTGSLLALRALTRTTLSLPRYATLLGINPLHFSGARADDLFSDSTFCSDYWPRFGWQDQGRVSHEDLSNEMKRAEEAIEQVVGFFVAPKWHEETVQFPANFRRGARTNAFSMSGRRAGIQTSYGKLIAGGVRGTTLISQPSVSAGDLVYTDSDSDGFPETAVITLSTAAYLKNEIKIFHYDSEADERWEVRTIISIDIDSVAGTTTVRVPSWELIDPYKLSALPGAYEWQAIDITGGANLVANIDAYRIYNDTTQAQVTFHWDGTPYSCSSCSGLGCAECGSTTQDGCLTIADAEGGYAIPIPASYDAGWTSSAFTVGRNPDRVTVRYYAGYIADNINRTYDPLDNLLVEAIFYLATARLRRRICGCSNVMGIADDLQMDMAVSSAEGNFIAITEKIQDAPFGSRRGEWLAWQRVELLKKDFYDTVAII